MEILENEVIIQSSHWFKYVFFIIATLTLSLGLFFFKKIPLKIRYILPVFGGMFIIVGFLSWFAEHHISLKIRSDKVNIEEQINGEKFINTLDMTEFSHLEVMKAISVSRKSNNSQSESIRFVLQMMRKNASPLQIYESQDLERIFHLSQKVQTLTKLKLYVIANQRIESESFFAKFKKSEGIKFSKKYPIESFKASFDIENQRNLSQKSLLQKTAKNSSISFSWTNRKNIIIISLFGSIIFLFFFLMHKVIIPSRGWKIPITIGYVFLWILGLLWFITFIFSIFGKSSLTLEKEKVIYQTNIFGQTLYKQKTDYKNIASIINEINPNQSGVLQILTHKGYQLFGDLATKETEDMISTMMDLAFNMKNYLMQIDVSVLTIAERLYLEQEIQKKILLNR